jgi:hypothetical protein
MSDLFPILFAILVVAVGFITSMNRGAQGLLISGGAFVAAVAVLILGNHWVPELFDRTLGIRLLWKPTMGVSVVLAAIVFFGTRILLGRIIRSLFGGEGPFNRISDGIGGGILSIVPSLLIVLFLFACVRIAGTLHELNYTISMSRDGVESMGGKIPPYPLSGRWRNSVEAVPGVAPLLDRLDPFSNRARRNTAALVTMGQVFHLRGFLLDQPETAELAERDDIEGLAAEPSVAKALEAKNCVALVLDPAVAEVSEKSALNRRLASLSLRSILERYVDSLEPAYRVTTPLEPAS